MRNPPNKARRAKPYQRTYTQDQLEKAVEDVNRGASIYSISKARGIPWSTLKDKVRFIYLRQSSKNTR